MQDNNNYEISIEVKEKIATMVKDEAVFECFNELFKTKKMDISRKILDALKSQEVDNELVGLMRYYKGQLDAYDQIHFYLVNWKAGIKNLEKKEEEEKKKDEKE